MDPCPLRRTVAIPTRTVSIAKTLFPKGLGISAQLARPLHRIRLED